MLASKLHKNRKTRGPQRRVLTKGIASGRAPYGMPLEEEPSPMKKKEEKEEKEEKKNGKADEAKDKEKKPEV